jgi:flavin-dependent thymidylate synthase
MKVTLIDYTRDAIEKLIYTKSTRLTQGKDTRLIIKEMSQDDKMRQLDYVARSLPSSWEFVNYTFEILGVTRAFTHQLVRSRTGSYAQQAQRINVMDQFTYETGPTIHESKLRRKIYDDCMYDIQKAYNELIKMGAKPEDARGLLPTNIHTNIIAQFNLRALSDLVRKRWTARVQDEYRSVVVAMVEEVLAIHPWAEKFLIPDKVAIAKELEDKIDYLARDYPDDRMNMLKLLDLLRKD